GSLTLIVRLDLIAYALPFVQGLQARALDRCDMHENIASAVVRFYKAITLVRVKEFDCSLLRHGTHSLSFCSSGRAGVGVRAGRCFAKSHKMGGTEISRTRRPCRLTWGQV